MFLSNPGKVHFEGSVHLLRYIRDNKNLRLKYYSKIEDAPLSDPLIHAKIKSDNQLMVLSDSICKYCPDTSRSTGAYILFFLDEPIDYSTHVRCTIAQFSADCEYNAAYTAGFSLAHFRMLNNYFLNKDPYVVP